MFQIAKVENNDELRMTNDKNLLPLPHSNTIFPILNKCGKIRVMAVLGNLECLNEKTKFSNSLIC